jgi:hypothetical protein
MILSAACLDTALADTYVFAKRVPFCLHTLFMFGLHTVNALSSEVRNEFVSITPTSL